MKIKFGWKAVFLLVLIVLYASNLRAPITAVGPVIPDMADELALTPGMIGLFTAIPLICFSLFSTFMPRMAGIFGLQKFLLYSLILLILGLFLRSGGNISMLFAGSIFIGIAITMGNVLMPAYIKKRFPNQAGWVTGFYLLSMNLASAIAVGYSLRLGDIGNYGWKGSLAIWWILGALTLIAWIPVAIREKNGNTSGQDASVIRRVWRSRLAWQISIFMGLQSVIFYVFAAWLPTMLQGWGMDADSAGWVLSYFQMGGVPMMLIGPLMADKMKKQNGLIWLTFLVIFVGLLLIIIWKTQFVILASILVGVGIGLAFALATMFFILRTRSTAESAALSGMSQSVGYFEAALGPPLFGLLYAWTGGWFIPMLLLFSATFLLLFTGLKAARDKFV